MFDRDKKMSTYDEEKFYASEKDGETPIETPVEEGKEKKPWYSFLKKNASNLCYNFDPKFKVKAYRLN